MRLLLLLLLSLAACTVGPAEGDGRLVLLDDDDDSAPGDDDDDSALDDDDSALPDDDDSALDDDDSALPDDDDSALDDDDDDSALPNDDDSALDDDDAGPDDDDSALTDDDDVALPDDDDDSTLPDDDDAGPDDDDTVLPDDDDALPPDDDDSTPPDDDDATLPDDDDDDSALPDDDDDDSALDDDDDDDDDNDSASPDDDDSAALPCPVDAWEPNDDYGSPTPITPGSYLDLSVCGDDVDWFSFEAGAGQSIGVDLLFTDAEGDVDIDIYDPNGWWIAQSNSNTDNESLDVPAWSSGPWSVRVLLWGDGGGLPGNEYQLDLAVGPCAPDDHEPNDSSLLATPVIVPHTDFALTRCPGDVDWFEVWAFAGETLAVDLTFAHADTNLQLEIYEPAGPWYAGAYSGDDDERLTLPSLPDTGGWLVRVIGVDPEDDAVPGTAYGIDIDVY